VRSFALDETGRPDFLVTVVARARRLVAVAVLALLGGCGGQPQAAKTTPAAMPSVSTLSVVPARVPKLRGLTLAQAEERLKPLGWSSNWIDVQSPSGGNGPLVVCYQRPPAGEPLEFETVSLALTRRCPIDVPDDYTGRTVGETKQVLDRAGVEYSLFDGVDVDFPASADDAPPNWVLCEGSSLSAAIEDAIEFLHTGETLWSGILYEYEGDEVTLTLFVAPTLRDCYTTNDGDPP
jgi:hypothetical protein